MTTIHPSSPSTLETDQAIVSETLNKTSKDELLKAVRNAGIVGAGGAGFPTYVKLQSKAEIFLVNAAECEPLLKVDQQLMAQEPSRLIRGLQYGMSLTGAKEGIIALKKKYSAAISALTPLLPSNIRIHVLPDIYPAGDEVITIWLATGRQVAAAALPISIGVIVNNVQTLIQLADTFEQGKPVTKRTLTVNGAVANPITFTAPIGITLAQALALAGGVTINNPAYILGGPMMGKVIEDLEQPVTKTTGGLLVLPQDHILIKRQKQSIESVMTMARNVCEQCKMCTELCPRHLVGHELSPSEIVKAVCYEKVSKPSILLSALTCSECGICEAYACPVEISPMRINKMLKKQFREQGARYEGELRDIDPMFPYRMVPTKRLISRLDLNALNKDAPMQDIDWDLDQVCIPLQQHIGKASNPIVSIGDKVSVGQCIATPDEDALGVSIHSSICGVVHNISSTDITITKE
ncbi:SLBB domain-containing protein [Vibrio algarum]|uniref:SLBB domain-containing protein n=1 Tax=Vibrio algarum TaxID=3020714 RepID=A0ABT4YV73_9VIBR|nr:SLBB domain-containing protein [Vibrio sp. KJ40-1]MDB1125265.1 SLBB domain-containing protein [Vibrio sp. KJ40-1]